MGKQLNQNKVARLAKKIGSRAGGAVQHEMILSERKPFHRYEEFGLIDIDKILRFYLVKQRDKIGALANLVTLVNNIIESTERIK